MAKEKQRFFVGDHVQTQWGDRWVTRTVIRVEWNEAMQRFYYFLKGAKYMGYPVASLRKAQ